MIIWPIAAAQNTCMLQLTADRQAPLAALVALQQTVTYVERRPSSQGFTEYAKSTGSTLTNRYTERRSSSPDFTDNNCY